MWRPEIDVRNFPLQPLSLSVKLTDMVSLIIQRALGTNPLFCLSRTGLQVDCHICLAFM